VRGPIAGDTEGKIYWTGDGAPKVATASMVTGGGGATYPNNAYTLGIPAPTIALSQGKIVGDSVDTTQAESRAYVYTFVSGWGEEGPPSPASIVIDVEPSQSVSITGIPGIPNGAYNITHKRIYRTATGPTGTEFKYVGTILAAATTFDDTVATVDLGETMPSTTWDMPPENLHSLKLHPAGFMVGLSGKDVCLSMPYMPHAWPEGYRIPIDHTPIGIGIFGSSILVVTDSHPYVITGNDPAYMTKERLEINQACVSKRGIVDVGYAVAYPSPDGLIVVGSGTAKNATENLYLREQWKAKVPAGMFGAFHDGKLYGFFAGETVVFDLTAEDAKTIDLAPTAAYSDPETDTLYLMVDDDIVSFDTDQATAMAPMTWRSKIFVAPAPVSPPGIGHVRAAGYPVTVKLYADGILKHTEVAVSGEPFRMAGGYLAQEYEVEIEASAEVFSVALASTMKALREAQHT